uniref:DNA primase small subunit n=1 Tax=Mesocestoides corti TaxID=53468 RepID=A0A5K3FU97_MESCO
RREFSFSLAGDVYVRYQSFNDASSLRKELVKSCPHKIDIGAVYSAPPKLQRSLSSASFTPEWKELVFDIDLTDYDEIRFCCGSNNPGSETAVCHRCWQLAKCAVVCMDRALREDFGFEQILWVFSGRRGVHCWVCDPAARRLDSVGRTAVAEYLSIVHGAESRKQTQKSLQNDSRLIEPMLHPLLESSAELLKSRFADYCVSQDLLSSRHPSGVRFVLKHLPADMAAQSNSLDQQWTTGNESGESTAKRWNTLKRFLKDEHRNNVIKDIILKVTYPRLDINVTTG